MLKKVVDTFTYFLMRFVPYITAIKIKDSITVLASIFIGIVLTVFLVCYLWKYAEIQWKDFDVDDNIVAVRFTKDGRSITYVDPPKHGLGVFNFLLALVLIRFSKKDTISVTDLKRIKRIVAILVVLGIFATFLATAFVLNPEMPPGFRNIDGISGPTAKR